MACFGCKNTVREDFEEGWVIKTGSLPKKKKKNPWISWSRPKKSPAKTVSVSVSMSEKLDSVGKSQLFKMDDVLPSKKHRHHTGVNAANKPYKVSLKSCSSFYEILYGKILFWNSGFIIGVFMSRKIILSPSFFNCFLHYF